MNILEQIILETKKSLKTNIDYLKIKISQRSKYFDFERALREKPGIIAEIKRASPSKGLIRDDYPVLELALNYEEAGARCISVLTEEKYFKGSIQHLEEARACNIPLLRKDFIIDESQIYEAAAFGADAILLIVRILSLEELIKFKSLAKNLRMSSIFEVHNSEELSKALEVGATIIGVNNRDLTNFKVDLNTSIKLKKELDSIEKNSHRIFISESGIQGIDDISLLMSHGINCFLIGEAFMKSKDNSVTLRKIHFRPLEFFRT